METKTDLTYFEGRDIGDKSHINNIFQGHVRRNWRSLIPPHIDDYELGPDDCNGRYIATRELEYPCDPPGSWVISGPVGVNIPNSKGRRFRNPTEAMHWAEAKYGKDRVKLLPGHLSNYKKWMIRVVPCQ